MKKILSAQQIRDWDAYTIAHEPIASIDLMERASVAFTEQFVQYCPQDVPVYIFAGVGNNGGDALAIARLLHGKGYGQVKVYVVHFSDKPSEDFKKNAELLPQQLEHIRSEEGFPDIPKGAWVIDGIFGSGLSRPVTGWLAQLLHHINQSTSTIVAIDIASGLFCDEPSTSESIIKAHYTITFQNPKLALLLPENTAYVGDWKAVPIGLMPEGVEDVSMPFFYSSKEGIKALWQPRGKYSHKGTFGHGLLVAGSYGKMGAAYLAAKAMLRSGAGLVSVHLPQCGYQMMQMALPEAMCSIDPAEQVVSQASDVEQYSAVAIGPGLGQAADTRNAFKQLLIACKKARKPLLIDADAINMMASSPELLAHLPLHTVFTPHPKEFERLVGHSDNNFQRIAMLQAFCKEYQAVMVLKGAHTAIGLPDGKIYFNSTGNPGLATAGSGDTLAGIITAFLTQGYAPAYAAIMGVYLHGLAGDFAAEALSQPAMIASDIIDYLGKTFLEMECV